jgi:hypothetical protein
MPTSFCTFSVEQRMIQRYITLNMQEIGVPFGKPWRWKWRAPGIKGMVSAADLRDVPPEYASYLLNADLSREFGAIRKAPGFDRHDADNPLPDNFPPVLSMGWFTYVDVWRTGTSEDPSNSRMGRLIVQCNGNPSGTELPFDFYYRDYSYDDDEWLAWQGPFTNEDIYGAIKPDRIRWSVFPGVIRGACGAESDSDPLWMGYVNRNADDDNGYFHDYIDLSDQHTFVGTYISESVPETTYGFDGDPTYIHWQSPLNGYKDERIRILAVPVFDGHQVSDIGKTNDYGSSQRRALCVVANFPFGGDFKEAIKANFYVSLTDGYFPERLTGFNFYESIQKTGIGAEGSEGDAPFGAWKFSKHVDIRTGNDTPILRLRGVFSASSNNVIVFGLRFADNAFNNMFIDVDGTKYKITDTIDSDPDTEIQFTHSLDGTHDFTIEERWGTFAAGSNITMHMYFDGSTQVVGDVPSWLPDPNLLGNETFTIIENQHYTPIICNYKHSILFEDRHIVGNVYYDGVKHPLMMRWGYPTGDPLAGHDIFPFELIVPSHQGDEIMGFAQTLNVLTIFTRENTFRYVFEDNIPKLQESPFNVGLYAPDSLATINGIHWFFGQRGPILSVFTYDGIHEPQNVGEVIQPDILWELTKSGIQPGLAIGWYDKRTNDYNLALTRYTAGDVWELTGSAGAPSRTVATAQPSQPTTPDRIVPSYD